MELILYMVICAKASSSCMVLAHNDVFKTEEACEAAARTGEKEADEAIPFYDRDKYLILTVCK